MYVPLAAHHVRRQSEALAGSALPDAPVRPAPEPPPPRPGRARLRAAAVLRRSADRLAPSC